MEEEEEKEEGMEKLEKKGAEGGTERILPGVERGGRGGVRQEVGEIKHLFKWQACFATSTHTVKYVHAFNICSLLCGLSRAYACTMYT